MPGAGRLLVRVHGRTHSSLLRVVSVAISLSRWQHRGGRSREDGFVEAVGSCRSDHVPVFDRRSLGRHTHASSSSRLPKASRTCGSSKSSRSIRRLSPRAIRVDSVCVGKSVLRADRARLTRPSRARRPAGGYVAFPRRVERDHASRADVCLCRRRESPRRHESEPTRGGRAGTDTGGGDGASGHGVLPDREPCPCATFISALNRPKHPACGRDWRTPLGSGPNFDRGRVADASSSDRSRVADGSQTGRSRGRTASQSGITLGPSVVVRPGDSPALRFTSPPIHHLRRSNSPSLRFTSPLTHHPSPIPRARLRNVSAARSDPDRRRSSIYISISWIASDTRQTQIGRLSP